LNLVKKIAARYTAYADFDDLIQEGYFGLMVAADMYEADQGTCFASYACIWLKQSMKRYIDNCGSCIRVPTHRNGNIIKLTKIINNYLMEFGQEPTDKELCCLLGVTQDILDKLKVDKLRLDIRSLDDTLPSEDGSLTLGDTIADDRDDIGNVVEIEYNERLSLVLWDEVAKIGELESDVLRERYIHNQTMQEAADRLGITTQDVRTAEARAFRNLRKNGRIRQYRDDIISSRAYSGSGLNAFLHTNTSSTERVAIDIIDHGIDKYMAECYVKSEGY
jgi:RNA polymerase primary sigma factor